MVRCYLDGGMTWFALVTVGLLVARTAAQLWLNAVNRDHVKAHASAVPAGFDGVIEPATYAKSVQYTLAKSQLSRLETVYDSLLLLVILFSGVLPWAFGL